MKWITILFCVLFAHAFFQFVALSEDHFVVKDNPTALTPFTNWVMAAADIQSAINAATAGDTVFVSNGVFGSGGIVVHGQMTNRVAVNKAIQVKSVNGPSLTVIQGAKVPVSINGDAAVRCAYVTNGALLSGFSLINGATRTVGELEYEASGGGIWCEVGAVVSNCIIDRNSSHWRGGGAYQGSFFNCIISSNNCANFGGGVNLGVLTDCTISSNKASSGGGGALESVLNKCVVRGNSANSGGGLYSSVAVNSLLIRNRADSGNGGGAAFSKLVNCTVVSNSASSAGGGVHSGSITNCIVYFNVSPNGTNISTATVSSYSCSTPTPAGIGNINNNPLFVGANDYHLSSGSACRDSGNNNGVSATDDLDGLPRIVNMGVDMGAYEVQVGSPSDSDGDGIPNWWEVQKMLSVTISNSGSIDGDWMTDYEEYVADTHPTNGSSYFPLVTVTNSSPDTLSLIVNPTSTARVYGISWNTNLLATPQVWNLLPLEQTGTGSAVSFTVTNDVPGRSYRTGVRLP